MSPLRRIPICAALGLTLTDCDTRRLPDLDAADPIVGQWRSLEVSHYGGITVTQDITMTIEEDLTAVGAESITYDAPGTELDDEYGYALTITVTTIGTDYRIRFRIAEPDQPDPNNPGTIATCTIMGSAMVCDPDDEFLDDMTFEREA